MKTINQSAIFERLQGTATILNILRSTNVNDYVVSQDDLALDINFIRKRMSDPMRLDVINAIEDNNIRLLLTNSDNDRLIQLPPQFVAWRSQVGNSAVTYVNIAHFGTRSKQSGEVSIPRSKLYTLMQYGYIMTKLYNSPTLLDNNTAFLLNGCKLYSNFNIQVVNRTFGISTTPTLANSMMFAYAKFFLVTLMDQEDNDRTDNIARQACSAMITDVAVSYVNSHFNFSEIADWFDFLKLVTTFHPRLAKVTPTKIIQDVTNLYGNMMFLALDCPQYLILNAIGVVHMAQINTEFRLEKVFDKPLIPFYSSLVTACR